MLALRVAPGAGGFPNQYMFGESSQRGESERAIRKAALAREATYRREVGSGAGAVSGGSLKRCGQ
jgi:hypothetical protein